MGLFDWLRCAAPLDDRVDATDVFQTKDLDCCMDTYWVDPHGHLWRIDESGTYDIVEESAEDILRARENQEWLPPFRPVPNGNHGKVTPHLLTRTVRIYAAEWLHPKPDHSDWPEYELVFRDGKLILVQTLS